jgi:hypothetical protein
LIRSGLVILFLFVLYEGFSLFPEKMVVIPGVFRLRDLSLLILPLFFVFSAGAVWRTITGYRAESRLVLAMMGIILLGPLMASFWFGQDYLNGLMIYRHNLTWISFFLFVVVLRDLETAVLFLKCFTVFIGIWVVLLLATKYFPQLGMISAQGYYEKGKMMRFGEARLYFPNGSIPIYLFCISLACLLHGSKDTGKFTKLFLVGFVLLVFFAVTCTFTRILIASMLLVTLFAFATCRKPLLSFFALSAVGVLVIAQLLAMEMGGGIDLVEQSRLGKMALKLDTLEREKGRELQLRMCLDNFLKSPVFGVGNLIVERDDKLEKNSVLRSLRKYGYFTAADMGYPRMAAEQGLVGLVWLAFYVGNTLRRSRDIIRCSRTSEVPVEAKVIGYGTLYFTLYLLISGVTLGHFVASDAMVFVALAMAILAIAHKSLNQAVGAGYPDALGTSGLLPRSAPRLPRPALVNRALQSRLRA